MSYLRASLPLKFVPSSVHHSPQIHACSLSCTSSQLSFDTPDIDLPKVSSPPAPLLVCSPSCDRLACHRVTGLSVSASSPLCEAENRLWGSEAGSSMSLGFIRSLSFRLDPAMIAPLAELESANKLSFRTAPL